MTILLSSIIQQALPSKNHLPAFSCVTLTEGWFWKLADAHRSLKTTKQIVNEWLIPQNEQHCTLIVNAPPNREGRLEKNLVHALKEIGKAWKHPGPAPSLKSVCEPITTNSLAQGVAIRGSRCADTFGPDLANDGILGHTWYTANGEKHGWLELTFPSSTAYNTLVIVEPIGRFGDYPTTRIGNFYWECDDASGGWEVLIHSKGGEAVTTHKIPRTVSKKLRLRFDVARDTAHINEVMVFDEPERVSITQ